MPTGHPDQKIQKGNRDCKPPMEGGRGGPSIYPVSLWIHHVGYQDLEAGNWLSMIWNPPLEIPPEFVARNRVGEMDRVSAVYPVPSGRAEEHAQSEAVQPRAGASRIGVEADEARVQQNIAAASSSRQEVGRDAAGQLLGGALAAAATADASTGLWEDECDDG